jgi:putative hemolysin
MIAALLLTGVLCGILLSAFFSAAETGIYRLNPLRVAVEREQGVRGAAAVDAVLRRQDELVTVTLVGANLADFLTTICVTALCLRAALAPGAAELYATLVATPLILIFGALLPKDYVSRHTSEMMRTLAPALLFCGQLLRWTGARAALQVLSKTVLRGLAPGEARRDPEEAMTRARALSWLREGAAGGGLSPYQQDVIDRIMRLSNLRVTSVMISRARAATIPRDMPREDFLRIARMAHFARYPVWEGSPSRVTGVIAVIDVITDPQPRPLSAYVRPIVRLTAGMSVTGALLQLQNARQPMAAVVDGRGECLGILTVKDLVEEIVGDIEVW